MTEENLPQESNSESQETKPLTVNDPVEPEVVEQLAQMERARMQLTSRNAHLDLEKDRTLSALKGLEAQHRKIYEKILLSRSLPPTTVIQIDEDGKIEVLS